MPLDDTGGVFERNRQWVRPGDHVYNTPLKPMDEARFLYWIRKNEVPFDPHAGVSDYDMRGFWSAMQAGDPRATRDQETLHFPDYWKTPYHETFSNESQWATPDAPLWADETLHDAPREGFAEGGDTEEDAAPVASPGPKLTAVDYNPFAPTPPSAKPLTPAVAAPAAEPAPVQQLPNGRRLVAVDYDPFAKPVEPPKPPGLIGTAIEAGKLRAVEAAHDVGQVVNPFATRPPEAPDTSPVAQLLRKEFGEGITDPKWIVGQIAGGITSSWPAMATGLAGAAAGAAAGAPFALVGAVPGAIAGGIGGYALGSMMQSIGPAYQQAIAQKKSHDEAVEQAWKVTGLAGLFGALAAGAPAGLGFAAGAAVKRQVAAALADMFIAQPGIGVGEDVARGAVTGDMPTWGDVGTTALGEIGGGIALEGGAHAGRRAIRALYPPGQEAAPGATPPAAGGTPRPPEPAPAAALPPGTPPPAPSPVGTSFATPTGPLTVDRHTADGNVILTDAAGNERRMTAAEVSQLPPIAPEPPAAPAVTEPTPEPVRPPPPMTQQEAQAAARQPGQTASLEDLTRATASEQAVAQGAPPTVSPQAVTAEAVADLTQLAQPAATSATSATPERAEPGTLLEPAPTPETAEPVQPGQPPAPAAPPLTERPISPPEIPQERPISPPEIAPTSELPAQDIVPTADNAADVNRETAEPPVSASSLTLDPAVPETIHIAPEAPEPVAPIERGDTTIEVIRPERGGGARPRSPDITNPVNRSLYTGFYDALTGRPNILSSDPMVERLRPFYDRGLIHGPEDIQALVNADFDPARAGLERAAEPAGPVIEGEFTQAPEVPEVPALPAPIANAPVVTDEKHTRTGKDIFFVRFPEKPDIAELGANARRMGGQWSSFVGGGMQKGWMFKTRAAADRFAAWATEKIEPKAEAAPAETPRPVVEEWADEIFQVYRNQGAEAARAAFSRVMAEKKPVMWVSTALSTKVKERVEAAGLPWSTTYLPERTSPSAAPSSASEPATGEMPSFDAVVRRAGAADIRRQVDKARDDTEERPTAAQAEAGNYSKGRVNFHGLPFVLETPTGAFREGPRDAEGKPIWRAQMPEDLDYGYISRTEAADGDHVDAYLGPEYDSQRAFVIDQVRLEGGYDEAKVMLGFNDWPRAREAYIDAFSDGRGADRIGNVTPMSLDELKTWLKEGDTKNPVGQQALSLTEPAPAAVPADLYAEFDKALAEVFPEEPRAVPPTPSGEADVTATVRDSARQASRDIGEIRRQTAEATAPQPGEAAPNLDNVARILGALFEEPSPFATRQLEPGVDADRYEKAHPAFKEGLEALGAKGGEGTPALLVKLMQALRDQHGFDAARIAAMRPYVIQFIKDVKSGHIRVGEALRDEAAAPTSRTEPETDRGIQGTLPPGDAGAGAEDVHGAAPPRPPGPAPAAEEPRGAGDVQGAPGTAQGPRPGGAPAGGGNRPGDTDRVPTGEAAPGQPGAAARPPGPGGWRRPQAGRVPDADVTGENHVIQPGSVAEERTPRVKARDNISAIELAKSLIAEGRPATKEEQGILARYVGWGGLANAFPDPNTGQLRPAFTGVGERLKQLLTEDEYRTAARSTQYAHYTSEPVIRAMWNAVERMGFKGGMVFEPGMGIGHFLGMMPPDLAAASKYQGLELDHVTAQIAKLLYPQSGVRQADFTRTRMPIDTFDLAIGNPPFGDITIRADPKYAARGFLLHDYFFAKSLDSVRPGGLMGFVTSAGTMNKLDGSARRYLAERAEFVGGVRLPSTAFAKNAGTEVTTDILFFKKRPSLVDLGENLPEWTETIGRTLPDVRGAPTEGNVNRYFSEHPEMVLGEEGFFDKLYKGRYAVHETPGTVLSERLAEAFDRLPENIMDPPMSPEQKAALDFSATEKKEGSFYVGQDGRLMQYSDGVGRPVERRGKGIEGGKTAAEMDTIRQLLPIRDALRDVFRHDLADDAKAGAAARASLNRVYDNFVKKNGPINKAEFSYRRPSVVQQEGARHEAREEAREMGDPWVEGTFDPTDMIAGKASAAEIARARTEAREMAQRLGREFDEGTFDPSDMPDIVVAKRKNIDPFQDDQESYRLRALEDYNDATGEASKRLVFYENTLTREQEPEIKSPQDGILWSMNKHGRLDIDAIAEKLGSDRKQVIEGLGDTVMRVPGTEEVYEPRDAYLSGDVVTKLAEAKTAAERDPSFQKNVSALDAVQPEPLSPADIAMNIGMPWVPVDTMHEFIESIGLGRTTISYSPLMGQWIVEKRGAYGPRAAEWGTEDFTPHELVGLAMNRKTPIVRRHERGPPATSWVDQEATQQAQDKVNAIRDAFEEWAQADPERAHNLATLYNAKYNRIVLRQWNGDYLTTPGVSTNWHWRPHQTRVVARIIQDGNTYMAHAVGAGKTSAMIGAGMEMRRLGLVNKPMYVVPNHMLGQFAKEFYEQYQTARIAVADDRNFHTSRRKQFVANVAQQDLDAIIITNSAFKKVPIGADFQEKMIREATDEIDAVLIELGQNPKDLKKITKGVDRDKIYTVKQLQKRKERLEQKLRGAGGEQDVVNTFEEMGVDFLFVDEAHQFRKLAFVTQTPMKGISAEGSDMAWDLYTKIRYLDENRPGRSLVMASGTPVTNTMGELFSLSRYMQPQALKERGLSHFDSWAAAFGTTKTETEPTPEGTYQEVTRFRKFVNMPELYKMVASNMDIVTSEELAQYVTRPALEGGKRNLHVAPRTPWLDDFQKELQGRVEDIKRRKGPPQKGDDILLSIINDGRKGAIDPRLIVPSGDNFGLAFAPESKLNLLVDNVHRIWAETKNQPFFDPSTDYQNEIMRGPATQMVFSNLGINGGDGKFSGYDWMRREWVRRGIPADQIAFIRDYTTPVAKQRLLNDVNDGKVRILVGSTQKMGTGINAQRRLIAIHNLDPLWFPADDEQRNGRGLRQGNFNPTLQIHDYTTLDTYDAQMWGLMAKKAGFIEQFFRGDPNLREMEDIGEASQYEQAAAMTISDPRIMQLTGLKQDLAKLERRQRAHSSQEYSLEYRMREAASEADSNARSAAQIESAIAKAQDISGDNFRMKVGARDYAERKAAAEAIDATTEAVYPAMQIGESRPVGEIGGFPLSIKALGVYELVNKNWVTVKQDRPSFVLQLAEGHDIGLGASTGPGVIQSASAHIRDLPGYLEMYRSRQADAEQRAASNRAALGKPFTEGEKIEPLRRQISELEAAIYAPPPASEQTSMGVPGQMTALDEAGRMGAPEQMRTTAGQFGLAEEGPDFAEPQFFSALTLAVEAIPQPKAPGAQWANLIRNLKGVKQDEIAWSGIEDWLKEHPGLVTKDELLDQLRANEVRVEEVQHGPEVPTKPTWDETPGGVTRYGEYTLPGGTRYRELLLTLPVPRRSRASADAEFESMYGPAFADTRRQLAEARTRRDRREAELRMEYLEGKREETMQRLIGAPETENIYKTGHWDEPNVLAHIRMDDRTDAQGRKVLHIAEIQSDWHQQGRRRGYQGDPINLDWSQGPREFLQIAHDRGNEVGAVERMTPTMWRAFDDRGSLGNFDSEQAAKDALTQKLDKGVRIPNAPFKTQWPEIALKRVLRYGAEHGYDRITFDTGETQAARYDLSKRVSSVSYDPDAKMLLARDLNGREVMREDVEDLNNLPDFIGKDAADKLIAKINQWKAPADGMKGWTVEPREFEGRVYWSVRDEEGLAGIIDGIVGGPGYATRDEAEAAVRKVRLHSERPMSELPTLEGLDLRVGGEGMKGFYDKMLPSFLNKYAKRWGAKVGRGEIPTVGDMGIDDDHRGGFQIHVDGGTIGDGFPTREAAETRARELRSSEVHPVHAIDIPPPMRESVMRGQALWEGERGTSAVGAFRDLRDDYAQFRGDADPHKSARDWTIRRGEETGFEHLVAHAGEDTHAYTAGLPRAIDFNPELLARLRQEDAGAVLHHNHPGGTALSGPDVSQLALPGLDRIIAHGGGDTFVARLTPEAKMWALSNPEQADGVLGSLYRDAAGSIVKRRLQALINQRGITQQGADRIYADIVNRSLDAAGVLDYVSSRSIEPLKDFWAKALIREAATRARKVADAYGIPSPAEDFDARVHRSTLAVRPEETMAGLPRPDVGEAAAGRPGREAGAGERGEDAGRGRGLAEEPAPEDEAGGAGRGAPPRPPGGGEAPPPSQPPPNPPGTPTREQVTADLSKVVFRDTRSLAQRARDFVNDLRADWSDKFKQGFLDDTTGQAVEERGQNAGKLLPHEFSPTWNLRLTRNVPAMMSVVMGRRRPDGSFAGGALRFNDGVFQIDPAIKPFAEVAKPIFDAKLDDVTAAWLIANRARRLKAEGRENLVSDEFIDRYADIDQAYQREDGTNPLREFREGWRALSRATLDLAENRGLINAEQRALWEHEDYVPFYRHREDDGASGPGSGRRATQHLRSGIRRLKGGESQLNDIYDNMMQHLTSLVGRSIENHAKRLSVDLSAGTGALTPLSKSEREALETPEGRLRLEGMGLDPDQMSAEAKAAARGLWGMLKNDDPNVISLMIDGKPKFYRVNDPLLLRSLVTVGPEAAHGLIYGVFRGAKQILSKSVTLDPGYMARNLMRDTAQTAILTGTGGVSTVQGMREALGNSPSMLAIMAGGGGGSFFYNVGPGQTRRTLSASQRRSVLDTPIKLLQALEHLGMASENANRIATYNAIKARGGSEAEAITAAQDLLNFSMRGDHVAMRTLIDVVPFFNARVQGLYRLYRGAKEDPVAFMMRGSILTAAALALWWANHDDDRYKALEDWDKQSYFHFFLAPPPKPGEKAEWWHHLRLPSPFETGAIFAKIPEMFMDYSDNGRIKQLRDAFLHNLTDQLSMSPIPQLAQPILDLYANREHFTGRPIVNDAEAHLLPEKRFGPNTNPTMVAVGQAFGVSPDQAQALVRGYGGTVATYLLAATDALSETMGLTPSRATKRLDQLPVVASFVREDPALATRWSTEFYDLKNRVEQVHNTIQKYKKEGDAASIKRLIEDNKEALEAYPAAEKLGKALGKIRGAMNQINTSSTLTPDQKREQLDKMIAESNRTAALVQSMLRRYEGLAPQ